FGSGIIAQAGQAFSLNGTGAHVHVTQQTPLQLTTAATIEGWVNYSNIGTWHEVVSKWDAVTGFNQRSYSIGTYPDGRIYFAGRIDDASLYNTVLSDSQILSIYNAGRAGKCVAPKITTQPQSQTIAAGANVTFSVGLAPACSPLVYQWFHNGSQVSGATASSLPVIAAHLADAGSYTVSAVNSQGSTLSASAPLTVQQVATPTF